MKKLLLSIAALTAMLSHASAQKGLGLNVGANFSNIVGANADEGNKIKPGFQAGINYNIPVGNDFYIQPGVNYMQNGTKPSGAFTLANLPHEARIGKIGLHYIQVPVTLQYQPQVGSGHLLLGAGPFVAMGVGDVLVRLDEDKHKVSWDDAQLKKVDAGVKAMVGYQLYSNLSLNLNADFGLTHIDDSPVKNNIRNASFGLAFGYRF